MALILCDCPDRSTSVINALESEHDIWHVARVRDAMAFVHHHRPDTIVIDLDMAGLDATALLDAMDTGKHAEHSLLIGICAAPDRLAEEVRQRMDQLVSAPPPQS